MDGADPIEQMIIDEELSKAEAMVRAGTPAAGKAQSDVFLATDVRSVLPTIQVPTLVLSRGREPEEARFPTPKIPGATLVQLQPAKE